MLANVINICFCHRFGLFLMTVQMARDACALHGVPEFDMQRPEVRGIFETLLMESAMPDDESDTSKRLNLACPLVAIEMIQAAQDGGVCDDSLYATANSSTRIAWLAVPRRKTRQNQ
jgi:hypothetical protein